MNRFDFSQIGGFPLTQDRLDWMQSAYLGGINGLAAVCGADEPITLSGIELTSGVWNNGTVSDGWIFHPQLGVLPFEGGVLTSGNLGVAYVNEMQPLQFQLSGTQNVQIKRYAKLGAGSANAIKNLSEKRFAPTMAAAHRTSWQTLSATNGNGELRYRIDHMARIVYLNGYLDLHVDIALQDYVVGFKNIPAPDPLTKMPVPVLLTSLSANTDYIVTLGNQKRYDSVAKLLPAVFSPFLPPDSNGLRLVFRTFEQFPSQAPNVYQSTFNFSYHF